MLLLLRSALRLAPLGVRAVRPLSTPSYTERMNKTGRPVSPHVTIYKFPVAAISSITTRVTGVLLTIGTTAIGGAALAGADVLQLVSAFQQGVPVLVPATKFVIAFPLTYHWLSALRHTVRRAARAALPRTSAANGAAPSRRLPRAGPALTAPPPFNSARSTGTRPSLASRSRRSTAPLSSCLQARQRSRSGWPRSEARRGRRGAGGPARGRLDPGSPLRSLRAVAIVSVGGMYPAN